MKVSTNLKIAMQCFEIFGGEMPQILPPGCAPASSSQCSVVGAVGYSLCLIPHNRRNKWGPQFADHCAQCYSFNIWIYNWFKVLSFHWTTLMHDSLDWMLQARATHTILHRSVTNLRHQEGRRVFWEGPKIFELCPIVLNYVQHILPGGAKYLLGGLRPPRLRTWFYMIVHLGNWLFYSCTVKGYNAGLQLWRDWRGKRVQTSPLTS